MDQDKINELKPYIHAWANGHAYILKLSGSLAKGTGITGTTDIDLFISLDPSVSTCNSLENVYCTLRNKFNGTGYTVREQNVSIGINHTELKIDVVAGIEARGFIFGSVLANKLNVGFVPIRKPGKLPYEIVKQEYELEYGTDRVEIHKDAISKGQKVLLIDDLLATGGTSLASANLIEKLGGKISEIGFVIELPDLHGRDKLNKWSVYSIVSFEGE